MNQTESTRPPLDPMKFGEFFEDVDWKGAFRSPDSAWICNWRDFLGIGY